MHEGLENRLKCHIILFKMFAKSNRFNTFLALITLLLFGFVFVSPIAKAQVMSGTVGSAGILGNTSRNTAFQGSSSSFQAQAGNAGSGSAQSSLLNQTIQTNLSVDPTVSAPDAQQQVKNKSLWKVFGAIAALFLAVAIVMFVLGLKNKGVSPVATEEIEETIKPEVILSKPENAERKKSGKKKKANQPNFRRKKKRK